MCGVCGACVSVGVWGVCICECVCVCVCGCVCVCVCGCVGRVCLWVCRVGVSVGVWSVCACGCVGCVGCVCGCVCVSVGVWGVCVCGCVGCVLGCFKKTFFLGSLRFMSNKMPLDMKCTHKKNNVGRRSSSGPPVTPKIHPVG